MPYTRRSTWPDERDDYIIRCEGLHVGRVYLAHLPDGDRWLWTIYVNGHVPQIKNIPIDDLAVTLDEAASQVRQSYEAIRTRRAPEAAAL